MNTTPMQDEFVELPVWDAVIHRNSPGKSEIQGSTPLSMFPVVSAPDEATETTRASVRSARGDYFAAVPTSEAMEPKHLSGDYIVFRSYCDGRHVDIDTCSICERGCTAPKDGEVVYVFLDYRAIESPESERTYLVCIRRYGHDAAGNVTLTADAKGFPSWTVGTHAGLEVRAEIAGVGTSYKPILHNRRQGVECF